MSLKIVGKLPDEAHLKKLTASPNFKNGAFQNLSRTEVMVEHGSFLRTLKDYLTKPKNTKPQGEIPSVKTNLHTLNENYPVLIWFGHSSYFIKINNKNILIDPVFSGNASPFSFMVNSFIGTDIYNVEDLPCIDILILTHDHYDHLDYKTIIKLKDRVKSIYCSLGVSSHLDYWGLDKGSITEMDWCDSVTIGDITLTAAPARHFSGRLFKRGLSLWSSFILKTEQYNLYLGGDSGYDSHFKEIGNTYGPFDLAILESGQYNTAWASIHMMPEETVEASIDLRAKILLPVHWGKFDLALHPWKEPIQRVLKKAKELDVEVTTPLIGEPVLIGQHYPKHYWWEF